jgi:hypothetical protein
MTAADKAAAEKRALDALDDLIAEKWNLGSISTAFKMSEIAYTLKAMLADPRMPAEPSEEALNKILSTIWGVRMGGSVNALVIAGDVYRALYAHLSAPRTNQLYRIRGKGLDLIHEGPISISEASDENLPDIEG